MASIFVPFFEQREVNLVFKEFLRFFTNDSSNSPKKLDLPPRSLEVIHLPNNDPPNSPNELDLSRRSYVPREVIRYSTSSSISSPPSNTNDLQLDESVPPNTSTADFISRTAKDHIWERCRSRRIPMRLLDTESYEIRDMRDIIIQEEAVPSYAILSHTWLARAHGDVAEVTYQDYQNSFLKLKYGSADGYKAAGWAKLKAFCKLAKDDGYAWAWMDTCCIDKTSLIDTQKAINAMFHWYQNATICYAHLVDIECTSNVEPERTKITDAAWFTRGWTLQEFLAPSYLQFVDKNWKKIGTKSSHAEAIEEKTGISQNDMWNFKECSIAKKLSWSAERKTTEVEDEAYCLLGLFGIRMPLIYGEGQQAFTRLQEELIKTFDDESIFAWRKGISQNPGSAFYYNTFLAPSIRCFYGLSNLVKNKSPGFSVTNHGLQLESRTYWKPGIPHDGYNPQLLEKSMYFVKLACNDVRAPRRPMAILIHQVAPDNEKEYKRSWGATVAIGEVPTADSGGKQTWEIYDDFLAKQKRHRSFRRDPRNRILEKFRCWTKVQDHKPFTIVPSGHDSEMPHVLLVALTTKVEPSLLSVGDEFAERHSESETIDKQGLKWTQYRNLESKGTRVCFLLHDHLKYNKLKLPAADAEVTVALRSPAHRGDVPNSPEFGLTRVDLSQAGDTWRNTNLLKVMPVEDYSVSVDLFPIPLRPSQQGLPGLPMETFEALRRSPKTDFRAYRMDITVVRKGTDQVERKSGTVNDSEGGKSTQGADQNGIDDSSGTKQRSTKQKSIGNTKRKGRRTRARHSQAHDTDSSTTIAVANQRTNSPAGARPKGSTANSRSSKSCPPGPRGRRRTRKRKTAPPEDASGPPGKMAKSIARTGPGNRVSSSERETPDAHSEHAASS